jgi:hypothetical protein
VKITKTGNEEELGYRWANCYNPSFNGREDLRNNSWKP